MTPTRVHWERYWRQSEPDNVRRLTQALTAEAACRMLGRHYNGTLPDRLLILDLGCGDGRVTAHIAAQIAAQGAPTGVRILACDISSTSLAHARPVVETLPISLVQTDAGELPFPDGSFDGAMSFGYASVASYWDGRIQRELFRVIKPQGWLIADFRNHLSLWFLLFRPSWLARWLRRFRGLEKPQYHLSLFGVGRYFAQHGFQVRSTRFLLSFPPLELLPETALRLIERTAGALHLNRVWGRVFFALMVRRDASPETQGASPHQHLQRGRR